LIRFRRHAVVGNMSDGVVVERALPYPWHQLFTQENAKQTDERDDGRSGRAHAENPVESSYA
jgi:hypothetical protein